HLPEPKLVSGRFSPLVERCLKACQILAEPLCRVAGSISRRNGSPPSFSRSQVSRLAPCRAPQFHQVACSYLHGVYVWHSEESARQSHPLDSETLLQQNPLAAWLGREEDVLAEIGRVETSTGRPAHLFILQVTLLGPSATGCTRQAEAWRSESSKCRI